MPASPLATPEAAAIGGLEVTGLAQPRALTIAMSDTPCMQLRMLGPLQPSFDMSGGPKAAKARWACGRQLRLSASGGIARVFGAAKLVWKPIMAAELSRGRIVPPICGLKVCTT